MFEVGSPETVPTSGFLMEGRKIPQYSELSYKHPYWWNKEWRARWDGIYNVSEKDKTGVIRPMETRYAWRYHFSGGVMESGKYRPDPPSIFITQDGDDYLEVLENVEPAVAEPGKRDEDWKLPPIVEQLVGWLNSRE